MRAVLQRICRGDGLELPSVNRCVGSPLALRCRTARAAGGRGSGVVMSEAEARCGYFRPGDAVFDGGLRLSSYSGYSPPATNSARRLRSPLRRRMGMRRKTR